MKPAARKRLVGYLQEQHHVSERRACRVIPISRKAVRYEPTRPQQDAALVARLKALGEQYPRYGYLMLHSLLRSEGRGCEPQADVSAVHRARHAGAYQTAQEAGATPDTDGGAELPERTLVNGL